jgi:hypothetical protein
MQKQLILVLGVLLGSYLPAGAQTRSTQLSLMQERPPPRILLAATPSHLSLTSFLPVQPLAERPARFTVLLAAVLNRHRSLEHLSPVDVVKTAFVRQARVGVVQLWGGRLQLGGFASTHHMENVLLGLSGSADLLGFRISHPGVGMPRANRSYGLSLTFRLGGDAHTDRRVEGWRCLTWIVGAGHGCRL